MVDRRKPESGAQRRSRPVTTDGTRYCFNLFDEVPTSNAPETQLDEALKQRRHRRNAKTSNSRTAEQQPPSDD